MGKDLNGKELGKGLCQRKDGSYCARYYDRNGQRKYLYNSSLAVLKKEYKDVLKQVSTRPVVKTEYTLDEWYAQWIKVYKYEVRDSTRLQYSHVYTKHVSPALGHYLLTQITTLEVKRFLNDMKKRGFSFEMRNKARIVLLDLFDKAIMDDFAFKNPARGIKVVRDERVEPRVLSKEEQVDFFDTCKGTFYEELFTVAVLTGLRPVELFALRWSDVNLKEKYLDVTRTLLYQKLEGDTGKAFHIHPPKTATSLRRVYFDERCKLALMSQFRKKSNISLRETSSPLEGLEDLLFVTKYNTPLNSSLYSSAIQRIVDLINESRSAVDQFETFSGHCFRHTYATRAFEADVDPKVVQKQLGHATLKMTMDLYTHLFEDKKLEELTKLDAHSEDVFTSSDSLKEQRYRETLNPKVVPISEVV